MLDGILAKNYGYTETSIKQLRKIYSLFRVIKILKALRKPSKKYYIRVNTLKTTQEEVISFFLEKGIKAYPVPYLNDTVFIEVKGPCKLTKHKKYVIADKAAAESVYMGANLYGPGVLKATNVREGDTVSIYSPQGHLVAEGIARMDGTEMMVKKRGLAVETLKSVYIIPHIRELELYKKGFIHDQSLPSILSIHILNPYEDWKIVDMCAGPGGKTTLAAQLMKNRGNIMAIDRTERKINRITENCERLGIKNVKTYVMDSRHVSEISEFYDADAVILDPPCSALGVRPKLYYDRKLNEINALVRYQKQFVKQAIKILKNGGLLLYTTCTLTLDENEENILWTIKNFKTRILPQRIFIGAKGIDIVSDLRYTQRFEPDKHDTPGFYIALIKKLDN